jgi:hypothetical protein
MEKAEPSDVPLLKEKKPRPPKSEKQMEAFAKTFQKRQENIKKKNEEKLLEAQRALLQKEGYIKKELIQFKVETDDEEPEHNEPKEKPSSKSKANIAPSQEKPKREEALQYQEKKNVPAKIKQKQQVIIEEEQTESDASSSSEEEIIVVKRKKTTKKQKKAPRVQEPESEEEEEYVAKTQFSYHDFFV